MVLRQRYVSAKWGISADVITMGLFGDHIVSKHLVKLMGSQKKQEVKVGHRGLITMAFFYPLYHASMQRWFLFTVKIHVQCNISSVLQAQLEIKSCPWCVNTTSFTMLIISYGSNSFCTLLCKWVNFKLHIS
ncbi:hypothetical protein WN944_021291 [Citrus x changshan-huyou]|uniref:Uncharacterized protein n=1 Tax=Citrus x changshan-huyou TaxID=2935761 RepID=A0AAP0MYZ5_9ROSI